MKSGVFFFAGVLMLSCVSPSEATVVSDAWCKQVNPAVKRPLNKITNGGKCTWTPFCDYKHSFKVTKPGTKTTVLTPEDPKKCHFCEPKCPEGKDKEPTTKVCVRTITVKLTDHFDMEIKDPSPSLWTAGEKATEKKDLQKRIGYNPDDPSASFTEQIGTATLRKCTWSDWQLSYHKLVGKEVSDLADLNWVYQTKSPGCVAADQPADVLVSNNYVASVATATICDRKSLDNKLVDKGDCPVPE